MLPNISVYSDLSFGTAVCLYAAIAANSFSKGSLHKAIKASAVSAGYWLSYFLIDASDDRHAPISFVNGSIV